MPRAKDRKPVKAAKNKGTQIEQSPTRITAWWKKPPRWVGGVLLVALGAALSAPLQFMFGRLIETFTPRIGDPISAVATLMQPDTTNVVLPQPRALSEQDLEALTGLGSPEQMSRLEKRGAIPLGSREITVELQSNRPYPVRVTGINPVSECEEVARGSLVKTSLLPTGTTSNSTIIAIQADDPGKGAQVYDPIKIEEPFFPGRTITLTPPERDYLVLRLMPSTTKFCRVQVEITVLDRDREVRQRITPGGRPIPLLPLEELKDREAEYSSVYLAGEICHRPVLAEPGYQTDVRATCGPDNLGTEPILDTQR